MGFRDNLAPPRVNPVMDRIDVAPAPVSASKQELTTGQASKFRTVSTAPKEEQNVGNQVKVQANTKGTGIAGRPSSIGEVIRDTSAPAKVNPTPSRNQTTAKYEE